MIKTVNKARKDYKIWDFPLIERKVLSNFYAFTRGKFLVVMTNQNKPVTVEIIYLPFNNGQRICNIFNKWDCLIVENGGIEVQIVDGEAKIYVEEVISEFE